MKWASAAAEVFTSANFLASIFCASSEQGADNSSFELRLQGPCRRGERHALLGMQAHRHLLASDRVAGVGMGVFLILFFMAFCLVLCLLGSRSKQPWAIYTLSTIILLIVVLVLVASPKGTKPVKPATGYDQTIVPLVIIMAFICVGILLSCFGMLAFHVSETHYARPLNHHTDIVGRYP